MKILVLNSGSSSLKYQLFDMAERRVLARGTAERIGEAQGRLAHRDGEGGEKVDEAPIPDHGAAIERIAARLGESGAIEEGEGLAGIGHRVVHGGEAFREPTRIDDRVLETIRELSSLAPLHNPANLIGIEEALAREPDVPQVAVFDTAFHQTLPPHAYHYAVPHDWYAEHGVRRYGFHGTSHAYVSRQAAALLGRPLEELCLVVLHLGNGASAAAVEGGRCIDTSMGLTPLEGLVMGTRSGDLDPALVFHMARQGGRTLDEIDAELSGRSGLLGLCGAGDMRDVLGRAAEGDARAALAVDVYSYRIRKYVGAYTAALGRLDALVFTAGVGEHSPEIRARVCDELSVLGIQLDPTRNEAASREARAIGADDAAVQVLVVPTNEELEIAEQTLRCIQAG